MINLATAPRVAIAQKAALPKASGVYVVLSGDTVVYVGASVNIRARWGSHHRISEIKHLSNVSICYFEMPIDDAARLEQLLITQLQPLLNSPTASSYPLHAPKGRSAHSVKINISWTLRSEAALQAVYQQMRAAGIPCERAGKPNVTAIIQYALEQTAKAGKQSK